MEFEEIIKKVETAQEFKEWREKHKDYFLAHAFVMQDEANKDIWQIGYYDKQSNKIATIVLKQNNISIIPEQEILKASQEITPLEPGDVKITVDKALEIADGCIKENYSHEIILKSFFIIQHLEEGTLFNITFLTKSFKTINIKISTIDGKIIKHTIGALANFS